MKNTSVLSADRAGLVYLRVTDASCPYANVAYPCAGLQYTMSVNEIPSAVAYVPIGNYIGGAEPSDKRYQSPQGLLEWLQSHIDSKSNNLFISCQLYEEGTNTNMTVDDRIIFDGYIVSGGVLYTAHGKSGMQVKFNCMGKAVKLAVRPLSSYIDVASASLINIIRRQVRLTGETAMDSGLRLAQMSLTSMLLGPQLQGKSIAEKLCVCIGAMRSQLTYSELKQQDYRIGADPDALAAFGGTTRLMPTDAGMSPECDPKYTSELYKALLQGTQSADIWTTVQQVLTSSEFALQLVPRWSCDADNDFKMDICPVRAWRKGYDIQLPMHAVERVSMHSNVMDRINEPEIVIGDFSQLYSLTVNDGKKGVMGIFGVYAKDKELNAKLRDKEKVADILELQRECRNYRVQTIPTPKWLTIAACGKSSIEYEGQDNKVDAAVVKQLGEAADPADQAAQKSQPHVKRDAAGVAAAFAMADRLAELLFTYRYRASDMAQVVLTPDMRFGRYAGIFLENMLGKTAQINFGGTMAGTKLQLRGSIKSISYNYTAGESSGASYQIMLDRVRLADAQMPEIEDYPVYKV